jgi:hypothetical protein
LLFPQFKVNAIYFFGKRKKKWVGHLIRHDGLLRDGIRQNGRKEVEGKKENDDTG